MSLAHIGHGYLMDEANHIIGRTTEGDRYAPLPGDLYLPLVGGGILLASDLIEAILDRSFTGRIVPFVLFNQPVTFAPPSV